MPSRGPRPSVATSGVAVAYQRAADFADGHDERGRSLVRSLGCWTALGDPSGMRQLMTDGTDIGVTVPWHAAAVRWLDGDAAAVAELRKAAPWRRAARAARRCSPTPHSRAGTGVRRWRRRGASCAGGPAVPLATWPTLCWCSVGRRRAQWRRWSPSATTMRPRRICGPASVTPRRTSAGDGDAAEQVLGDPRELGPLLWDLAERTAPGSPPDGGPRAPCGGPAGAGDDRRPPAAASLATAVLPRSPRRSS